MLKVIGSGFGRTGTLWMKAAQGRPVNWQVPVPDTPFPHLNNGEQLKRSLRRVRILLHWGPVALGAVLLIVISAIINA